MKHNGFQGSGRLVRWILIGLILGLTYLTCYALIYDAQGSAQEKLQTDTGSSSERTGDEKEPESGVRHTEGPEVSGSGLNSDTVVGMKLPGEKPSIGSSLEGQTADFDDVEMRDIFVEPAVGSTNISQPDLSSGTGLKRPYKHIYSSPLQQVLLKNLAAGEYSLNATGIWGALSAVDIFDEIVEAVKENPQYGYIKQCVFKKETKTIFIELRPSRVSYSQMNEAVEKKIDDIIDEVITDDMNTRDKVLAIADYIVKHSVYDYKAADMVDELGTGDIPEDVLPAFHAYGPLIEGKGCCMGYANALHLALNRLGILSVQDWGTLGSLGDHMWNSVNIDGVWYDFDITNYTPRLGGSALRYGVTDKISKLKHSISSYRFEE